jgi:hypothetical protein
MVTYFLKDFLQPDRKKVDMCILKKEGQRDEHISSKVALPNFSKKISGLCSFKRTSKSPFTMQG